MNENAYFRHLEAYSNVVKPEASCPNVGQEWGAKHSALLNFR